MPPLWSCRQARENRKSPSLRVLLVVAHPLDNAFAKAAAARIRATLERRGIEVDMIDLYADDFDPRLTGAERRGYFTAPYDSRAVAGYAARLMLAEKLVFVFPQWWFNVPAILKGFFDRVLVPGVAFDHPYGGGPLIPRLTHIDALWRRESCRKVQGRVAGQPRLYRRPRGPARDAQHISGGGLVKIRGHYLPMPLFTHAVREFANGPVNP